MKIIRHLFNKKEIERLKKKVLDLENNNFMLSCDNKRITDECDKLKLKYEAVKAYVDDDDVILKVIEVVKKGEQQAKEQQAKEQQAKALNRDWSCITLDLANPSSSFERL